MEKSKYLVTSALPYANGNLHIGHIAGAYLPADIFVRFLRTKKRDVLYFCGTDEHGAPISIKAEEEGVTPGDIVKKYHNNMVKDFDGLSIVFDNFSGTDRPDHGKLSQEFFLNLLKNGYIKTKRSKQFYCEKCHRFLADRYVEGVCPFCRTNGARGDQCDACGKLMDATNLEDPRCKICNTIPTIKSTKHWFLDLPTFVPELQKWIASKSNWKENIKNFIIGLVDEGLVERAITRDIDWGIPVPVENSAGKVLYVWFDAPIGYISSSIEYFKKIGKPDGWRDYWQNKETKLVHFIGKDNNIFHAIFWPAMLMGQKSNYILPSDIPANEFLNLEGEKLSTSKNWAIWVKDFLEVFDGELLRYYIARIAPENGDSDFVWRDFEAKVNGELANVLGNFANRVLIFSKKNFNGIIEKPQSLSEKAQVIIKNSKKLALEAEKNYFLYKVRKNSVLIMNIARIGNKYFDDTAPWKSIKVDKKEALETIYVCCSLLKIISVAFYPILPKSMLKIRKMLCLSDKVYWNEIEQILETTILSEILVLFPKISRKIIQKQLGKLKEMGKI